MFFSIKNTSSGVLKMSELQLNEPTIEYFNGRNVDKMPELIAKGMTPLSVSGLMRRILQSQYGSEYVRNALMHNHHDTGDGIAYHPDGRIKVVHDAKPLREMNSESQLVNGALVLPDGLYENLEGQEFTRKNIQRYVGEALTSKEAKSNPLWQALARDPKLLNEYVDLIFSQAKQQFDYDKNMGVYVRDASDVSKDAATMRPWFVGELRFRSVALGGDDLDDSYGRLVGVAPEAQAAKSEDPRLTLETRILAAANLGRAFEHNGVIYVPVKDDKLTLK